MPERQLQQCRERHRGNGTGGTVPCGEPGALCGEQCPECTPSCDDRVCGPDPACGESCGTCDSDHYCNIVGQCAPGANFCEGELTLTGSPVELTAVVGDLPEPAGGVIADAIFDLVEIRVYGAPAEPPEPRREAIRFFDGAASAEQVWFFGPSSISVYRAR